ncbi:MAG: hypothetical protein PT120_17120 [Aphanizomenon gracile PMC649.10]|jgi:hypothetical protein|nr:hypothetical protein [Aphanizomenon gracile PMC638.10]MDM3856561.1 hypothetical protein [Aphanizomenon gracile PMC649.10]MDM3861894.1 hypothetical protein [Aphanizomenon gracile PMC644.10]
MTKNVKIYNQSTSEVDWKYLEASQQLQLDKQTYGSDYIHLYVDDIEGDWLENWDWEDDLTDYIDAFYHHCEQGNYQFAFDTLKAGDDLLNQPENHEKCLELYSYLVETLELQDSKQSEINHQEILNLAKQRIFILRNNGKGENMQEEKMINIIDPAGSRLGYIRKSLDKVHNGVIRRTWGIEVSVSEDDLCHSFSQEAKASSGDFVVTFGIWYNIPVQGYFLTIKQGSETITEIKEFSETSTFSIDEHDLVEEFLKKIEGATWQTKSLDLDALPE